MNPDSLLISPATPEKRRSVAAVFPFLLCTALWGAFLWMIGRVTLLPYAAAGALASLFPLLCPAQRNRRIVGAALLALLAVAALVFQRQILGGLAGLANRLFAVSAARQRYLYDDFAVSAASPIPAVLWASALLAVCFGWLGARARALPGILTIFITTAACAYFGVTPGAAWLLPVLGLSGVSMMTKPDLRAAALLLVSAAVLAGLTLWLAPGENARISEIDDQLRDTLAITTVTQQRQPESTPTPTPETKPEPANKQPMLLQIRESIDPKTIILIVLIAAILLLLFVPAVIRDRLGRRRARNRAGMDSDDHAEAIRATFRYALLWLRAAGSDARQTPGYDEAYRLWQEAAFSDHAMTAEQREQMRRFQEDAAQEILRRANRRERLQYRVQYAL